MSRPDDDELRAVAGLIARTGSCLVITGAGVSAESGLPTYRGVGGLYERDLTEEGIPIEVALSGAMLAERPELTWRYLALLELACRDAVPSPAHRFIAELERRVGRALTLTQNVDGLHRAAGSRELIEIHGNIHRLRCVTCGHQAMRPDGAGWDPPCPRCGRPLRPDVVLFGEPLPRAALERYERELARGFDLILVIGTTASFPYIAGPVMRAAREGTPTVEINPGQSDISHFVTHRLQTTAGVALHGIRRQLERPAG